MLLEIVKYPARVLQRPARRVVDSDVAELPTLFAQMKEAMKDGRGIGLAAPQIGRAIRLFIAHDTRAGEIKAYVNPQIIQASVECDVASEGCLSFPELFADVERSLEITLQFQDLELTHHEVQISGWYARIIQHELDHLNGILLPDRAIDGMYEVEETEEISLDDDPKCEIAEPALVPGDQDGGE